MQVLLVHLSDIHIKHAGDSVLSRAEQIARAALSIDRSVSYCVLLVTGDIAFSGESAQYEEAYKLLTGIRTQLAKMLDQPEIHIDIVVLAGNHDCDFHQPNPVRSIVLESLKKQPSQAEAAEVTDLVAACQTHFRQFRKRLEDEGLSPQPTYAGTLRQSYKIDTGPHRLVFHCYNTAWCSERRESPGVLVFPSTAVAVQTPETSTLVVSAFHHPYQWLQPEQGRAFRSAIEVSSDLVLTGHEHAATHRTTATIEEASFTHVEAPVLQESEQPHRSGFNLFVVDLATRKQRFAEFVYETDSYSPLLSEGTESPAWHELPLNKLRTRGAYTLTKEQAALLEEPGVSLFQRETGTLQLSELYVYPDFFEVVAVGEKEPRTIRGEGILDLIRSNVVVLVTGDTYSGKTCLSKTLCRSIHAQGDVPLLYQVQGSQSVSSARGLLKQLVAQQYGHDAVNGFLQLDHERRVIVVDDFHKVAGSARRCREFLDGLKKEFGRIVLLAHDLEMDLNSLLDPRDEQFPHYRITPFGHAQRNELVERWIARNPESDGVEIARRANQIIRTLDTIVAKGCVPPYPVYILAILQASEASIPVDASVSTHGYYYELFIKAQLLRGSSQKDMDVLTGYLAYMAHSFFSAGSPSSTMRKFRELHQQYVTKYGIPLSCDSLLKTLCERNMLHHYNDLVEFRHGYVYNYFVASYLRDHLHLSDTRKQVEELVANTHRRKCADILLFLAHLSRDQFVINTLLGRADEHYKDVQKVSSLTDVSLSEEFASLVTKVAYEERDSPKDARRDLAAAKDDAQKSGILASMEDDVVEALEPLRELMASLHTLQVLGQILKNYPGHLEADTKLQLATAGYGIGARAWRSVFQEVAGHKEEVARQLVETIRAGDPEVSAEKLNSRAQDAMRALVWLCGLGIVRRIADALGAPELTAIYERLVAQEPGEAVSVVRTAILLDHNPTIPEGELVEAYLQVKKTPLAVWILRQLVVQHFHFFPIPAAVKQRICARLDINYKSGLAAASRPKLLGPRPR
ncbi:MAG: metallophosphoesterase [Deltaproteobacteria bacterium]|nr:metallophosphoesterase [Deltaproteobacteria bacterium]